MILHKILLLIVIATAVLSGYGIHQFLNKKINARQSFKHFIIYMLLNLASVLIIVFIFSFLIIFFKDFFFKK